jgi:predicted nucleotide-binding protein (sugar kinase/HSP70/actin superfamily)
MKLSFPYMGSPLIYQKLFQLFDHEVIMPPRPTKRTIDLGVKYSPEFACFPYKVLLGSYLEALELGADTIVTAGGSGPCRAGFYSEVHAKTLRSMGYDVDFIVFDDWGRDSGKFIENIRKVKGRKSWFHTCHSLLTVYELACAVDRLQKMMEIRRAYQLNQGSFNAAFQEIMLQFERAAFSITAVHRIFRQGKAILELIPCRKPPSPESRLRIGIVGEIYVVMESSINMNIAEILNKLGCEVTRSMYISDWTNHAVWPKIFANKSGKRVVDKSRQYLELGIGGHECHNIGSMIDYKEQGYDGAIHLMPFGCLPELITQSIIPRLSADYRLPVLSLSLDEQTGIANYLTRIEAFVELLKKIKKTA